MDIVQCIETLLTFHITEITRSIESSASPGQISRKSWNFSSDRLEYTTQIFSGELHVFLRRVLHVAMSTREWKVFCQYFCFIWLHFWLLCYRGEKLDVTYLQPWGGIPSCQACTYTQHTVLFCPMEWNMFHLCVGALALLDRKMATCQGCRWKELLSTGLLRGRVTWETLFFICSSLGSFTAALGPFHSSIIQDSHEVEKLCDALWYTGEMLVISKCEAKSAGGFVSMKETF